jgi:hypothetical protein
MLPASEDALSDVRLTRIINDELQGYMSELLISTREEYLLQIANVAATGSTRIRIPSRAAAAGIRQLTVLGADGAELMPERLEPENARGIRFTGRVPAYYVEGDDVAFLEPINSTQTVRFRYHYMPTLTDSSTKGVVIETIAGNRQSFTYEGAPIKPDPVLPALCDFIRLGGGNQPMGLDTVVQSLSTPTRTVTLATGSTVPSGIVVGDWAVAAGTTIIPPLPECMMHVLCQRSAYVALRAIGDPKADAALMQLQEMRAAAFNLMQPRTTGSPRYVTNKYAPGWW